MAEAPQTFSESWYRIAEQSVSLRPGVKVRRQFFRGELWYVLEDPFNNQFFRLRPNAHEFVIRLRPNRTVQQVWAECLERDPNGAPGQEEILRLISQLYFANLLQYDRPGDSAQLFERYRERRQRELKARWLNIMFLRVPLFDPDEWLDRWKPVIRLLFSWLGALVWLGVVGAAIKTGIDNFPELKRQSEGLLAPGNLVLLYLGLALIKTLHEFGHAAACKRFGGEVHVMGVMFLIFTPVPYMDATSSWGFRSRWQRMFVGAAGMIVEVFIAALAMFVWANTAPGTVHSLAYNMIFVASVSTVLFNANPLLRYDGYYMLSDFLEIPNLYQRANQQLKYYFERYLFGVPKSEPPTAHRKEQTWLTVYGILSHIYRVIVFAGILLFVADRFLILGVIMAVICLVSWIVVPIGALVKFLATSPKLDRCRPRAVAATLLLAGVVLGFLKLVPFPNNFRAPGILVARERAEVVNDVEGIVSAILVAPGTAVTNGQPLVQLRNPEIELEWNAVQARVREVQAYRLIALQQTNSANLKPTEKRLESVLKQVAKLEVDRAALVVRARQNGIWAAPELKPLVGRWLPRGADFGLVLSPDSFQFIATVPQTDVGSLFERDIRSASVRLYGQSDEQIDVGLEGLQVIPAGQSILPSAALGWLGGGEVPVAQNDPEGRKTAEPFFEVRARIVEPETVRFLHGRSGKIRFKMQPAPLLDQWIRRLRQLLQKRYQL